MPFSTRKKQVRESGVPDSYHRKSMVSSLDADHGNPRPGIPLLKIESENKAKQSERIPVIPRVTHTHTPAAGLYHQLPLYQASNT